MIFEEYQWLSFDLVTLMLIESYNFNCSKIVESNDALKQKFILSIGEYPDLAEYAPEDKRKILKSQFGLVPKREEQVIQKIFNQKGLNGKIKLSKVNSSSVEEKFVFQRYQESQLVDSKGNSINLWICQKKGSKSKQIEQDLEADSEEINLVKIVRLKTKVETPIADINQQIEAEGANEKERKQVDPIQSIIDLKVHVLAFDDLEETGQSSENEEGSDTKLKKTKDTKNKPL